MTPQEFGELIRTHREARGLSVEELALRFKLSVHTVRSIEQGTLDNMPHAVYAKGFIRAYAQAVGVPHDDLAEGLAMLFPNDDEDSRAMPGPIGASVARSPRQGGKLMGIFVSLLLVGLLCGTGWAVYTKFDNLKNLVLGSLSAMSPPMESSASVGVQEPSSPPAATTTDTASAPHVAPPMPPASTISASSRASNTALPTEAASGGPEAATTLSEPAGDASPPDSQADAVTPSVGKQVTLIASETCWTEVAADGARAREFTMYRGDRSVLQYKNKLELTLGNAGGVTLLHNGAPYSNEGKRNEKRKFMFQ